MAPNGSGTQRALLRRPFGAHRRAFSANHGKRVARSGPAHAGLGREGDFERGPGIPGISPHQRPSRLSLPASDRWSIPRAGAEPLLAHAEVSGGGAQAGAASRLFFEEDREQSAPVGEGRPSLLLLAPTPSLRLRLADHAASGAKTRVDTLRRRLIVSRRCEPAF